MTGCTSSWCNRPLESKPVSVQLTSSVKYCFTRSQTSAFCPGVISVFFIILIFLFIKDALNWSKVIYNVPKYFVFQINAVLLNFLFICESWKIQCITVSTKILMFSTLIIIRNVSWAAYYYDFWRSCDTEDCSNDAENTALITEIYYSLIDIHIENCYFTLE